MPGPVSDSYDPEFGTGYNAHLIRTAIQEVSRMLTSHLGERKQILDVISGPSGATVKIILSERDARVIRFAIERSLDTI